MKSLFIAIFALASTFAQSAELNAQQDLGKRLFFDPILSKNKTQSCAQCHNPAHAFIDNRDNIVAGAASLGDDGVSLGGRNAPTLMYAKIIPKFYYDSINQEWAGGYFHDGRGKSLEDQAGQPPITPFEMGMPNEQAVVDRLKNHPIYRADFEHIYGRTIFNKTDDAYHALEKSLAAFERSAQFATFDSKYDRYLRGLYEMSDFEELGRSLFFSPTNFNCVECHQLRANDSDKRETFTNYKYHNIGVPANVKLWQKNGRVGSLDHGLLDNPKVSHIENDGKFKVPTLRNIAITAPYMHNGVFAELSTVMEFYDKFNNVERVTNPETGLPWAAPEVPDTVNFRLLEKGKKMSDHRLNAVIAFLELLTDKRYEHLIKPSTYFIE